MGELLPFPVGVRAGRVVPPLDAERMAATLDGLEDYRVLRRLPPHPTGPLADHDRSQTRVGCALDVETTGLDHDADVIIELCVQRFRFDAQGRVVEVGSPRTWREDPGRDLTPDIVRITHLDDLDLAGQRIDDRLATSIINSADVVVAHNARFDRPFVESRLPAVAGAPWACSLNDVDWNMAGRDGRSLSDLVRHCGWFFDGHRAEVDVLALVRLLGSALDGDRTVLRALLDSAERTTRLVSAVGAPFSARAALKARRYRWNADERCWSREIDEEELHTETQWLSRHVYEGAGEPAVRPITWRERHGRTQR